MPSNATTRIPLNQGHFALIDSEDEPLVSKHKWRASRKNGKNWYVVSNSKRVHKRMHRLIMNAPDGVDVDHRNGNTLDNRRSNLRFANNSQNQANRHKLNTLNTSGYRGVTLHKQTQKWQAQIKVNGKYNYLGLYSSLEEAAKAYDSAATWYFDEFAELNFPDESRDGE